MKKILKLVFGLVALLIIGLVIAASLVDINSFKPQILAQAEKALGRKVTMEGDISLRILPTIAIKTGKVTISNPAWAGGGEMLIAESISLGAELTPLFSKQLKVNSLEIQKPVLLLVKKGSESNWQFGETAAKAKAQENAAATGGQKLSLSVKHVYIGNGDLTYKDIGTNSTQRLQDFSLQMTAPNMDEKVSFEGNAKLNGQDIKLKTVISAPQKMSAGERTNIEASVTHGKFSGVFKGSVQLGKLPSIKGSLSAGDIDLGEIGKDGKGAAATSKTSAGWSDAPVDFSALGSLNADLDVSLDSLKIKNMLIKPLKTKVTLNGGEMDFKIPDASVYGGKINLAIGASARGRILVSGTITDVQAEPFLTDWMNNDSILGTLSASFAFTATGKSERAMVGTLGGNAKFAFRDGAIKGKNLAANIRRLKSFGTAVEDGPQQTDFSEITGSVTASQGILHNSDLFMKSPLIRLRGEGEINLPTYQISYRLKPEIVGTLKGQGGKDDAAGVTVPLKISGNLNNPTYSIDAKAAIMENLTPEKIEATKENIKALKQQYKEGGGLKGLRGLLGQ